MRRAIVTGITSHVGSLLGAQLAAAGFRVHGLARRCISSSIHSLLSSGIRIHQVDGRTRTLISLFEQIRPDIVVHLASLSPREHLPTDIIPTVTTNILFGTQLLEAARSTGCRSFITTGSYLQHAENGRHSAYNLYAATKTAFEEMLAYFVDRFGFSAIVLTLCNVYSESGSRPDLLTQIMEAFVDRTSLSLPTGEAWVDLVHVEDVVAAIVQSIRVLDYHRMEGIGLSHYSVSSGGAMNCADLVAVFESLGLTRPDIIYSRPQMALSRVRPWRGICVPGWSPRIAIEDGVARLLAHGAAPRTYLIMHQNMDSGGQASDPPH